MSGKNQTQASSKATSTNKSSKRIHPLTAIMLIIALAIGGYFGVTQLNITDLPESYVLADGEAAVHYIDVGQGDSVLVQTTQGSVLIDGGENNMGSRVVEYIRDAGISELAYVIATHPHSDHIGGLITVLGEFPVGTLIMPNVAHTTVTFERFIDAIETKDIPLIEPIVGNTFSVGEAVFTIIAPNSSGYQDMNNNSISLRMTLGSSAFIFTGDAEGRAELEMTQHLLFADVLYVGHHGSNSSTTQEFLDEVNPSVAVISVGAGNSYGHPSEDVLDRLHDAGTAVYRTDQHGNIVIVTNGTELSIRSQFNGVHY